MKLELGNAATHNNQTVFDYVCHHMAAQGRQSANEGQCMYRSEEGLSCAVGCLIPDDFYSPLIESVSVYNLKGGQMPNELIPFRDNGLLHLLQTAHDSGNTLKRLQYCLEYCADRFKLNPSAIAEIKTWND